MSGQSSCQQFNIDFLRTNNAKQTILTVRSFLTWVHIKRRSFTPRTRRVQTTQPNAIIHSIQPINAACRSIVTVENMGGRDTAEGEERIGGDWWIRQHCWIRFQYPARRTPLLPVSPLGDLRSAAYFLQVTTANTFPHCVRCHYDTLVLTTITMTQGK